MNVVVASQTGDGIATITLKRPNDMNAVNLQVCDAMLEVLRWHQE